MIKSLRRLCLVLSVSFIFWIGSSVCGHDAGSVATPAQSNLEKTESKIISSEQLEEILRQPITFDYEDVAFCEVVDRLREEFGINVLLDRSAEDDSLSLDTIITCQLENVRLATGLKQLLIKQNATYFVDDGILKVISMDVASDPEFFRTRIFDCRNLLQAIALTDKRIGKPTAIRILPAQAGGGSGGFGGGGGGGGVFCVPPQRGNPAWNFTEDINTTLLSVGEVEEVVAMQEGVSGDDEEKPAKVKNVVIQTATAEGMLIPLIKTMVDADSWEDTNGDGSLMIVSGQLVVSQREAVLDQIGELLEQLERAIK